MGKKISLDDITEEQLNYLLTQVFQDVLRSGSFQPLNGVSNEEMKKYFTSFDFDHYEVKAEKKDGNLKFKLMDKDGVILSRINHNKDVHEDSFYLNSGMIADTDNYFLFTPVSVIDDLLEKAFSSLTNKRKAKQIK